MRQELKKILCISIMIIGLAGLTVLAAAPHSIVYQGRLADVDGTPVTGDVANVAFHIYDADDAVDPIWADTMTVTCDDNGVFTATIGSDLKPLDLGVFNGDPRFLGITVDTDDEMLPRQLLASAPYAISTQGGNSIEVGSFTQSGNLRLRLEGIESAVATLSPYSTHGGSLNLWDEAGNYTMALQPDGTGEGGFFAVYRSTSAQGFTVNGNYSANEPRVDITGSTRGAYFRMDQTGDNSVILPTDAVNSAEIINEPGIVHRYKNTITTTSSVLAGDTLVITVPASGYVILQASGYFDALSNAGGSPYIRASISETAASINFDNFAYFNLPSLPAGSYYDDFSINGAFSVTAGAHTYYLNSSLGVGVTSGHMNRVHFMATYYPTSYGTFTATKAAPMGAAQEPDGSDLPARELQDVSGTAEATLTTSEDEVNAPVQNNR